LEYRGLEKRLGEPHFVKVLQVFLRNSTPTPTTVRTNNVILSRRVEQILTCRFLTHRGLVS
jgi:hypothetical protein